MFKPIYHSIFDPLINQASAEFKKRHVAHLHQRYFHFGLGRPLQEENRCSLLYSQKNHCNRQMNINHKPLDPEAPYFQTQLF